MTDYRNLPIPLADGGLDIINPRDKIVPGKWASLVNVYPQKANIITQRKGFALFFNQGDNAGDVTQVCTLQSPNTPDVAFFCTTANDGTIGITDTNVTGYNALSTGWGNYPVFVGANPFFNGQSPFLPLGPVPAPLPFTATAQTYLYTSSNQKIKKFAYPPIFSSGSLFSELLWGLSPPIDTPTVSLPGSVGGQNSSVSGAEPYTYCYTFFSNLTGAESTPSPVSAEIDSTLQAIQVNFLGYTGTFDIQYDAIRVYRKGGTQVSTFRLAGTVSAAATFFVDTAADDTLSTSVALFEDNFRPFVTQSQSGTTLYGTPLPYIWGSFLGQYILACGDVVQPGNVFWTNAGRPDTMSPDNNLAVTSPHEPLMNGFLYGANTFVFSQQRLFALDYGGPTSIPTFVAREIPINMGLAAPFALTVSSLGGVFFLGNDGIYVTDCQSQIESITNDSLRPIFRGEASGDFPPVKMTDSSGNPSRNIRLFASGQELHFIYPFGESDTSNVTDTFHLVYNILQKSWRQFQVGIPGHRTTCGDPINGSESAFLIGTRLFQPTSDVRTLILKYNNNDNTLPLSDAGSVFNVSATTGGFDMEIPQTLKEFGNIIVDADPNGGVITVTPIRGDGTSLPSQTITGTGRQRFPLSLGDTYDYFQSYNFSWPSSTAATLYNIEVLFRSDEEVLKHWEAPPSSMGLSGWNHIRDGYIALRSTSDTTLTVNVDGTDYTYTIPSTNGQRRKNYVKLSPVKGKMFGFSLDSAPNTLNNGLVSFWDLEEATGATRVDSIGPNHLTSINNVPQVSGKILNAAGFATNQTLEIADASQVGLNPGTSDFSLSLWIYPTSFAGANLYWVISKGTGGGGALAPGYSLFIRGDGLSFPRTFAINFGADDQSVSGCQFTNNYIIPLNTWTHIALVFNRASICQAYANGSLVNPLPGHFPIMSQFSNTTGPCNPVAKFGLGCLQENNGSRSAFFSGSIDAVGYWSRALTQSEVTQLYNTGLGLQAPLNPSSEFRLYGEDSFLNIKPWNTAVGYKPISPFTAAGYAEFLRKEGGT